jgi:hypothetical protein
MVARLTTRSHSKTSRHRNNPINKTSPNHPCRSITQTMGRHNILPLCRLLGKHKLLHDSSHGYRKKRGCDTALLNLINLQEEVELRGGSCCISTWDMKKAFDTVHPDFVKIALERMGMDPLSANYYVKLNSQGKVIVRSPYAQHHLHKLGPTQLHHISSPPTSIS